MALATPQSCNAKNGGVLLGPKIAKFLRRTFPELYE